MRLLRAICTCGRVKVRRVRGVRVRDMCACEKK